MVVSLVICSKKLFDDDSRDRAFANYARRRRRYVQNRRRFRGAYFTAIDDHIETARKIRGRFFSRTCRLASRRVRAGSSQNAATVTNELADIFISRESNPNR